MSEDEDESIDRKLDQRRSKRQELHVVNACKSYQIIDYLHEVLHSLRDVVEKTKLVGDGENVRIRKRTQAVI